MSTRSSMDQYNSIESPNGAAFTPETTGAAGESIKQRVFTRVPFTHTVRWSYAPGEAGIAHVRDMSRGGLCLSMGRYLRPGRVLRIHFEDVLFKGQPLDFDARIVWCESAADGEDRFRAGFQILHGKPVTLAKVSEIFYLAITRLAQDGYPCHEERARPLKSPSLAS